MKQNDEFVPEKVEEQIDHLTYSLHQEPLSPNAQVIQELHAYYKEDQRSTERMWERLAPYMIEHKSTMLPVSDQPEAVNEIFEKRIRPGKPERRSARRKGAPQLALITAVFYTSLLVGSLLFVFQMAHSSHGGSSASPAASSHGLYINEQGEVSRLDPLTRKTIWRTVVPQSKLDDSSLVVFDNTVYVNLNYSERLYALNTSDGHIRWSDKNFTPFPLSVVDGLLYAKDFLDPAHLYALNTMDGKIRATYTPPYGKVWNSPTIVNGILYYCVGADLYAVTLTNQQLIWHQHLATLAPAADLVEGIQIKNGIVYTQVMVMNTPTGSHQFVVAFDARTGKKLWGPKTDAHILTITDTAIYTTAGAHLTSSLQFDAYDAHTGTLLWHEAINPSKIQAASDWHNIIKIQVDPNTLYVSYGSKSSAGGIAALKVKDGTLLWQAKVDNQEADSPLGIYDGALYTISSNGSTGAIDAFKTSDGSQLWHMPFNGDATQWEGVIA